MVVLFPVLSRSCGILCPSRYLSRLALSWVHHECQGVNFPSVLLLYQPTTPSTYPILRVALDRWPFAWVERSGRPLLHHTIAWYSCVALNTSTGGSSVSFSSLKASSRDLHSIAHLEVHFQPWFTNVGRYGYDRYTYIHTYIHNNLTIILRNVACSSLQN